MEEKEKQIAALRKAEYTTAFGNIWHMEEHIIQKLVDEDLDLEEAKEMLEGGRIEEEIYNILRMDREYEMGCRIFPPFLQRFSQLPETVCAIKGCEEPKARHITVEEAERIIAANKLEKGMPMEVRTWHEYREIERRYLKDAGFNDAAIEMWQKEGIIDHDL